MKSSRINLFKSKIKNKKTKSSFKNYTLRLFMILLILFLGISNAFAFTSLNQFPEMFLEKNKAKVRFVLGQNAMIYDGIAASLIIAALQKYYDSKDIKFDYLFVLDRDVDSVYDMPSIVIGGPCANAAASELFDYPLYCSENFIPGHGFIRVFEHNNPVVFVGGYFWKDTLNAAYVLANWQNYDLNSLAYDVINEEVNQIILS